MEFGLPSEVTNVRKAEALEQFNRQMDLQNALLAEIANARYIYDVNNWEDVQRIVRMGIADRVFTVGDQIQSTYNGVNILWDIIGIDHETTVDPRFPNSLTIQAHNVITTAQFDAWEALYYAETELAAGTYHFADEATTREFTLTSAVPAGGQIVLSEDKNQVTTYPSQTPTTSIEVAAVTVDSAGGTELTTINHLSRRYGSNNYNESAIRQWLNSDADTFVWAPQTNYDRPPNSAIYSGPGFLKLIDADLAAVLGDVKKVTALNTVTDGGGSIETEEKAFLISRSEAYGGLENSIDEGAPYLYYSLLASAPESGALDGRIKYNLSSSASYWWLRSPHASNAYHARSLISSGYVDYSNARFPRGVAPACVII